MNDPMNTRTRNFPGKRNRSSAPKPETLAVLNSTITMAVEAAIENFKCAVDFESLTPEIQLESISLLANNTSAAVAEYAEKLLATIPVDANGRI